MQMSAKLPKSQKRPFMLSKIGNFALYSELIWISFFHEKEDPNYFVSILTLNVLWRNEVHRNLL